MSNHTCEQGQRDTLFLTREDADKLIAEGTLVVTGEEGAVIDIEVGVR